MDGNATLQLMLEHLTGLYLKENSCSGCTVKGLPILKPFKLHYLKTGANVDDNNKDVGVFIIVPYDGSDGLAEIVDFSIPDRLSHVASQTDWVEPYTAEGTPDERVVNSVNELNIKIEVKSETCLDENLGPKNTDSFMTQPEDKQSNRIEYCTLGQKLDRSRPKRKTRELAERYISKFTEQEQSEQMEDDSDKPENKQSNTIEYCTLGQKLDRSRPKRKTRELAERYISKFTEQEQSEQMEDDSDTEFLPNVAESVHDDTDTDYYDTHIEDVKKKTVKKKCLSVKKRGRARKGDRTDNIPNEADATDSLIEGTGEEIVKKEFNLSSLSGRKRGRPLKGETAIKKKKLLVPKRVKKLKGIRCYQRKNKKTWIAVNMDDHQEKYVLETFPSLEQKNRGNEVYESRYSCLVCNNFKAVDKEEFEKHLEMHINGKLKCAKCAYEAHTLNGLGKHRQVCLGDSTGLITNELMCDSCGHVAVNIRNLKTHIGTFHDSPQFECRYCNEKFSTLHFRRKHRIKCHAEEMKYCIKCESFYATLTPEQFTEHVAACSREFPCPECGKMYVGKMNLAAHQRNTHRKIRRHQCHLCPYSAKDGQKLREHIHAHQGIHPHKCDQCTFTCVQPYQLKSHMRTHTGEKPYKCDECNYAAAWNVQLKEHKKAHAMDTAEMCQQCGVLCKNQNALSAHCKREHSPIHSPS